MNKSVIKIKSFSGGKDSTALILKSIKDNEIFNTIFCNTFWEHPLTYAYIQEINIKYLSGNLIVLSSDKYNGFFDLALKRKRVPSTMARFCTEELKVFPTKKYIEYLQKQGETVFLYQGIRAEESHKRSLMKKNVFDPDFYGCTIKRPLLHWTSEDVFAIHRYFGQEPNPLYKMGMKRVGCFPCVMVSKPELKSIFVQFLYVKDILKDLEQKLGRTFFPPNYIPEKYCSKLAEVDEPVYKYIIEPPLFEDYDKEYYDRKENLELTGIKKIFKKVPTVDDVYRYVIEDPDQLIMKTEEEPQSCMSYYAGVCE